VNRHITVAGWDEVRHSAQRIRDTADIVTGERRGPAPWLERLRRAAEGRFRKPQHRIERDDVERIEAIEHALGTKGDQHTFTVHPAELGLTRADTVGSLPGGGYLVDSFNVGYAPYPQPVTSVVDLVEQMTLGMGSGNVSVPTGASSLTPTYQSNETNAITDSTLSTGQVNASPHTLYATVTFSRLLGLQSSPDVNRVLNLELSRAMRAAVSAGIVGGSGVNGQVHGISGLPGIGTGSGATCALSNIVTAQQTVADANAVIDPTRVAFVAPPDTAAVLMQRFTSPMVEPLWCGNINMGTVRGVQSFSTKSMPASTMILGDWSTVLLVIWGGVEFLIDPFQGASGSNFKQGLISVRMALSYDVVPRYPVSFYSLTSIS
jgi:HK97 family phage major capsid protein